MKKVIVIIVMLCAVFAVLGCSSLNTTNRNLRIPKEFPSFVKKALKGVKNDVLVGIGVANTSNFNMSKDASASRARTEISRQINTMVDDLVLARNDGERSFKENITVTITQSRLVDAKIIVQSQAKDGSIWTVVIMDKSNVINELNRASYSAKLVVPNMDAFSIDEYIDAVFARAIMQLYRANGR
ncbi:MAG: hypothetical protein FWD26_10185 [Treponema sp.]|nr:hypothetical protein [Treponema sp.]